MALDATIGSAIADSMVDVPHADEYFAGRTNSYTEATIAVKEAVLKLASNRMLSLSWKGKKNTQAQSMPWPRSGVVDRDGYEIAITTIPVQVLNAACEWAVELVTNQAPTAVTGNIKKAKLDVMEVEFAIPDASTTSNKALITPEIVTFMIAEFIGSSSSNSRLSRA